MTTPLKYAVLELTNRCNLRCVHCASNSGPPREGEFSTDRWLSVLGELADLGGEEITLIGGELLLHPGWETIAREVGRLGMRLVIITNGLMVDDRVFDTFVDVNPHIIGVSLDGTNPETMQRMRRVDGFDRVMELLNRLVATGHPRVNAITTFCRLNFHEFDAFCDLLRGSGITWQVQVANPTGERFAADWSLDVREYEQFCNKVTRVLRSDPEVWICPMDDFGYHPLGGELPHIHGRWRGCMAGIHVIGIRSNGEVLPCLSLGDEFVCGDLRTRRLGDLWKDDGAFARFRNKSGLLTGVCASCAMAETCRAGCTAMAAGNGDSFGENPFCMRAIQSSRLIQDIQDLSPR